MLSEMKEALAIKGLAECEVGRSGSKLGKVFKKTRMSKKPQD